MSVKGSRCRSLRGIFGRPDVRSFDQCDLGSAEGAGSVERGTRRAQA